MKNVVVGMAAIALVALAGTARSELAYGITGAAAGENLIRFDTASPGAFATVGALTGVVQGQAIRGIDFRPATGQLYAVSVGTAPGNTAAAQLYTVDLATGALTPVGAGFSIAGNNSGRVSLDFNPVVDLLRVVSGTAQNVRVNPNTGAIAAVDGDLAYDAGDPNAADGVILAGIAYSDNNAGATSTTLYGWNYANDGLVTVGSVGGSPISPNAGTVFTAAPLPAGFLTFSGGIGMDISGATGIAYLQHDDPNTGTIEMLDMLNLSTGMLTNLGVFGADVLDISIVPVPAPSTLGVAGLMGLGLMRRNRRR